MNTFTPPPAPSSSIDWQEVERQSAQHDAERFARCQNAPALRVRPCAPAHWKAEPDHVPGYGGQTWTIVKNLGWLLKHWREVDCFAVDDGPKDRTGYGDGWSNAFLTAYDRDGRFLYSAPFASRVVLRRWLDRPVFRGLPVRWFGKVEEVGSGGYREVER